MTCRLPVLVLALVSVVFAMFALVQRAEAVSLHALTPAGCIADVGDAAGCGATQQGLANAQGVAVSPDGRSVYVAGVSDDAIVRFDRALNGALTPAGCIADVGDAAGCGTTQQGLNGSRAIAVSLDASSVYVGSFTDAAIVRFDRTPDGVLTPAGCIADTGDTAGCGATQQGLNGVRGVAVSPDGASVYAATWFDNAVVRFDRGPDGALTPAGCIADVGDAAGCGATQQGLAGALGVAVSPDDGSVYVAGSTNGAIARIKREVPPTCLGTAVAGPPGQVLTVPLDCIDPNGDAQTITVLDDPANGTLSAVNQGDDTVSYTPNGGFTGNDAFSFRSTADGKRSNIATAQIDVETPQGPPGPEGPAGDTGPQGESAIVLVALLAEDKFRARAGKRLTVRFATSGAGEATVALRKGGRKVIEKTKAADKAGVHRLGVKLATKRSGKRRKGKKPIGRGKYTLTLTVEGEDGQRAADSARLKVKKAK